MKFNMLPLQTFITINSCFEGLLVRTLLVLSLFSLLSSCNSGDTSNVSNDTVEAKRQIDTLNDMSERTLLIEELKELRAVLASNDKEKIAGIFQFPLPDTTVGIFIDDNAFNAQLSQNNGNTTRAMFLRFYPQISKSLWMGEIDQLFMHINLTNLLDKDTIRREVHIEKNPCFKYYGITIENNIVTLVAGSDVNQSYKVDSMASNDEVDENSSEFCENVMWWVFEFDGKNLKLLKIHGAG